MSKNFLIFSVLFWVCVYLISCTICFSWFAILFIYFILSVSCWALSSNIFWCLVVHWYLREKYLKTRKKLYVWDHVIKSKSYPPLIGREASHFVRGPILKVSGWNPYFGSHSETFKEEKKIFPFPTRETDATCLQSKEAEKWRGVCSYNSTWAPVFISVSHPLPFALCSAPTFLHLPVFQILAEVNLWSQAWEWGQGMNILYD